MNRAAAAARGRWLVLCNNDIEGTDGWLRALLDCANRPRTSASSRRSTSIPTGSLCEAGGIIWRDGTGANYGRGEDPDLFQYEYRREVDYGSAAALMVQRRAVARGRRASTSATCRCTTRTPTSVSRPASAGCGCSTSRARSSCTPRAATAGTDLESGPKRHQEENRPSFVDEVAPPARGRAAAHRRRATSASPPTAIRGPHVLVVDHHVPMWDRDAGSLRMLAIIRALIELGARVSLMAENLASIQPYTGRLQRDGRRGPLRRAGRQRRARDDRAAARPP